MRGTSHHSENNVTESEKLFKLQLFFYKYVHNAVHELPLRRGRAVSSTSPPVL